MPGAAYLFQAPKPAPVVRSSILPPAGTSFVTMLPASGPPVLSPDGTRLAFTARDDKSKVLLYVRPLNVADGAASGRNRGRHVSVLVSRQP